jgi:hypothetical protein
MAKGLFLFGKVPELSDDNIDEDVEIVGVKKVIKSLVG